MGAIATASSSIPWASSTTGRQKLGVPIPTDAPLTDEGLRAYREAYLAAMRALHAQGKLARNWPLRYLLRHTAFHTLDHAWEMEDKDLTADRA